MDKPRTVSKQEAERLVAEAPPLEGTLNTDATDVEEKLVGSTHQTIVVNTEGRFTINGDTYQAIQLYQVQTVKANLAAGAPNVDLWEIRRKADNVVVDTVMMRIPGIEVQVR